MNNYIEKDLSSKLTKKDYFLYLINRNAFILTSPLIILSLIVAFIFMVNKDGFQVSDLLYLMPILLFVLNYFQMHNAVSNAVKSNSSISGIKIKLDSNKYSEITKNGVTSLEYSKFYSYYEGKNYYYLYVDKVNALILPKREFTDEEISKINNYLEPNIKKTPIINTKNILGIIFSLTLLVCIITLLISMF